jgi:hypothetical protein
MENNCHICGCKMVKVRGKNTNDLPRKVCPTCMAEKLEVIREISDWNYGKSQQEKK